ncbi:MAG: RIP metalloprotease RseP, partial [Patescibacteria group bacterium]
GSFGSWKMSRRAGILVAGVTMNVILAFALLSIINLMGRPVIIDDTNASLARNIQIKILDIAPASPAEAAGLKTGDAVTGATVGGSVRAFQDVSEFKSFIENAAGGEVLLNIERGGDLFSVKIIPRTSPPAEEGALGVSLARVGLIKSPWYLFLWNGLKDTAVMIGVIAEALFLFFKTLIVEGRLMGEVAGPVGIAALTGEAYTMGWAYLFNLVAILSVNLAILNILPFPALDGGRLIFLAVEKIKGSPVSHKIENTVNAAGFVLLLALMAFVTWKDIARFF